MDVEARIFEKLDKIEARINDLCIRLSAMEAEYNSHIAPIAVVVGADVVKHRED